MAKDFTSDLVGTPFETALQAMQNSAANTSGDKKTLVVFYLDGGMDCHNFISPANTASSNRIKYDNNRSRTKILVDTSKQTLLPGSTEWQLHPRFFGKIHNSNTAQPDISTSDSEIAVTSSYERYANGVVSVLSTSHGLLDGDKVYADFTPFANTTPSSPTFPTDGLYPITYVDASKFTIIPEPLITGIISTTTFKFVKEKGTAMAPFRSGDAVVIMNAGPLVYPVYRNEFKTSYPWNYLPASTGTKKLPLQLSSHSDQKYQWQSATPNLPVNPTGWMGRMMDLINPAFNTSTNLPTTFSRQGRPNGLYAKSLNLVVIATNGLVSSSGATSKSIFDTNANITVNKFDNLMLNLDTKILPTMLINGKQVTNPMMLEYLNAHNRTNTNILSINTMLTNNSLFTTNFSAVSENSTWKPVATTKTIAQICRSMFNDTNTAAGNVSQRRQLIYMTLGGFDQHDGLIPDLDNNLATVSKTIQKFWEALNEVNTPSYVANNTLMLVYSEFGRSLIGNEDGSDHAWGGHVILVGKPVNGIGKSKSANGVTYIGKSIYGTPPNLDPAGPDFVPYNSSLIPSTPVDTIYATIAKWFGVPDNWYDAAGNVVSKGTAGAVNPMELVLPNLSNFDYNPSANIFAPTWAASNPTEGTFREMKGLLKDYTFGQ